MTLSKRLSDSSVFLPLSVQAGRYAQDVDEKRDSERNVHGSHYTPVGEGSCLTS